MPSPLAGNPAGDERLGRRPTNADFLTAAISGGLFLAAEICSGRSHLRFDFYLNNVGDIIVYAAIANLVTFLASRSGSLASGTEGGQLLSEPVRKAWLRRGSS